ncbi:hypothetical protein SAMD00019534_021350 [Acytostelium subglobosum LB1]|uniref:hypothetical protein n=1 Tax=Acytostelium subglobosum LB1 TaxID=1410327 RepID=UPI00064494BE|nr:hypothetical protein SAMD00019534_021350 [Acytostelium subglobosum LB1]GAM18960.1 hypothetical protein SAMD00019534_021350 [Acytostelium subglobosum LB1]|eukprot:XP_012758180.1 hypothetical protein SAMD00019534_021350 [Acytostelium subglobosum LB1]
MNSTNNSSIINNNNEDNDSSQNNSNNNNIDNNLSLDFGKVNIGLNNNNSNNSNNDVDTINKRYAYMVNTLMADGCDYFSLEKCSQRHPYLYHSHLSRYRLKDEVSEPFDRNAKISERLMENAQLEYDMVGAIDKELSEIDHLSKTTLERHTQSLHTTYNTKQESTWFKTDDSMMRSNMEEMAVRRRELAKQRARITMVLNQKRTRGDDAEEEEEEEEEEEDEDDDEEDESMDQTGIDEDIEEFIDLVKDMFIHGLDREFDYSTIDREAIDQREQDDHDDEDHYFDVDNDQSDVDTLSNNNKSKTQSTTTTATPHKVFNLGQEDDYDYEEEYRQSMDG